MLFPSGVELRPAKCHGPNGIREKYFAGIDRVNGNGYFVFVHIWRRSKNPPGGDSMLVNRIEKTRERYGMLQRDWCKLAALSAGILGTWKSRGGSMKNLRLVSDRFLWSTDWLLGYSDEMWRSDLISARERLKAWANNIDTTSWTINQRFVEAWRTLSGLVNLHEDVWATYVYMAEFQANGQEASWCACKTGAFVPGHQQIQGAVELTGLPQEWWLTGRQR
jgi:hypothetical protein